MGDEINYIPYLGNVLPSSTLSIPTFGRFASGEVWDGWQEIALEHPNYALWLSQIENKDACWAAERAERKTAREQRRQESKQQKTMP